MSDAPDTGSLWGKMFGLGPMMDMLRNPALMQQAMGMMQAVMLGAQATARVEAKLDILLREGGHDVDAINRRVAEQFGQRSTVILEADGADGTGGRAATSGAAHHGNGATTRRVGGAVRQTDKG